MELYLQKPYLITSKLSKSNIFLVSMLGPSPDWIVGVSGKTLFSNLDIDT